MLHKPFLVIGFLIEVRDLEEAVAGGRELLDRIVEGRGVGHAVDRERHSPAHHVHRELEMLQPGEIFLLAFLGIPAARVGGLHEAFLVGLNRSVFRAGRHAGHYALDGGQLVDEVAGGTHVAVVPDAAAIITLAGDFLQHTFVEGLVVRAAGQGEGAGQNHRKPFHRLTG